LEGSKFDKDEEFVFGIGKGRSINSRVDLTNL